MPQSAGDQGVDLGDGAQPTGTSGGRWGMTGASLSTPLAAYLGLGLFILAAVTVNVFTILHDRKGRIDVWKPAVWEYSSGVLSLLLMPLVARLLRFAPPSRRHWRRFGLVHGLGTIVYSLIHVGGFLILRKLIYAALGHDYVFGSLSDFIYEYRKDVLSYVSVLTVFAFTARREPARAAPGSPSSASAPSTSLSNAADVHAAVFDIREGARLIRVRTPAIIAATAAGNYVEFRLDDGRRPLMRTTLAQVEAALAAHGFVRTHRSWLVNAARLRSLSAEGSGDFQLELEGDVKAPLSRRFPEALARLRQS